ncbi:MAG: hypothetical protein HGB20_08220 [Chlorobiaceae bacterium]|nr:hypothetical protein [Chlorobiaceae bacterium]
MQQSPRSCHTEQGEESRWFFVLKENGFFITLRCNQNDKPLCGFRSRDEIAGLLIKKYTITGKAQQKRPERYRILYSLTHRKKWFFPVPDSRVAENLWNCLPATGIHGSRKNNRGKGDGSMVLKLWAEFLAALCVKREIGRNVKNPGAHNVYYTDIMY